MASRLVVFAVALGTAVLVSSAMGNPLNVWPDVDVPCLEVGDVRLVGCPSHDDEAYERGHDEGRLLRKHGVSNAECELRMWHMQRMGVYTSFTDTEIASWLEGCHDAFRIVQQKARN